jgi:hypothetical protein
MEKGNAEDAHSGPSLETQAPSAPTKRGRGRPRATQNTAQGSACDDHPGRYELQTDSHRPSGYFLITMMQK